MANKLGAARIAALREVRGELVAVLDADDVSHPERLARQVAFLDLHPEPARDGVPYGLRFLAGEIESAEPAA